MAKILIVDDDVRVAEFIGSYLRAAGHDCFAARTGIDALNLARSRGVDLMVLDLMLPGGTSGFEVCRRVRSDAILYRTPILLLSAMSGEEEVLHGLAQGADDFVPKPFDVHNLLQRIDALLRHSQGENNVDEMTSLPNTWAMKREVQRRVVSMEPFVLACAELMHLREFAVAHRGEARGKAIRHLARALKLCGERLELPGFMLGHMGGGYFVCILGSAEAERYCAYVSETWKANLPAFYESLDLGKAYQQAAGGTPGANRAPLLEILVCATPFVQKASASVQDLFDVLTQIRNSAMASKTPGVYFNRRA